MERDGVEWRDERLVCEESVVGVHSFDGREEGD